MTGHAWRSRRSLPAIATVLTLAAACTGDPRAAQRSPSPSHPASWSVEKPAAITHADCPQDADCAFGYEFDGVFVEVPCLPVVEGVSDRTIAVGAEGVPREARAIEGVEPRRLVAVRNAVDVCGGGPRWVAGIVHTPDRSLEDDLALSIAACRTLHAPYHDDQSCEAGGPARHQGFLDEDTYAMDYAWFPDVVEQVNAELMAGAASPHGDPASAIADFERHIGFPDCFVRRAHRQVCRIGHAGITDQASGTVVVEGVTQTRNADVGYDSQAYAWTVERLAEGPGWWVTRRSHQPFAYVSDSEADRVWQDCCPEVVVTTGRAPR